VFNAKEPLKSLAINLSRAGPCNLLATCIRPLKLIFY